MTGARGPQPSLEGPRVRLRPWRADDADAVFTACQDADIQRWTLVPVPYRREDAETFVGPVAARTWAVGLHSLEECLGAVGWWTVPAARGHGLTAEALRVLSRWVLEELGATRLEALVLAGNTASLRVAERAGYRVEGVLRRRLLHRGERLDVVMTSLLDTDPRP
jgi:RimJ/RimL family protein N-acetyltransferase